MEKPIRIIGKKYRRFGYTERRDHIQYNRKVLNGFVLVINRLNGEVREGTFFFNQNKQELESTLGYNPEWLIERNNENNKVEKGE